MDPIPTFWWPETNLGDCLNPLILRKLGLPCRREEPAKSELIFIGSVLERVPANYGGFVVGSGFIMEGAAKLFPNARVLAVRGRLTASRMCLPEPFVMGDPALLAPLLVENHPAPMCDVCVVPHYTEVEEPRIQDLVRCFEGSCLLASPASPPMASLMKIAASSMVVSSSLHGLVLADAFGIPSVWLSPPESLVGGSYKFRDYLSGLDYTRPCLSPDALTSTADVRKFATSAPARRIGLVQRRLREVVERVRDALHVEL